MKNIIKKNSAETYMTVISGSESSISKSYVKLRNIVRRKNNDFLS